MKLRHEPDTLLGPDLAMIRAERIPSGKGVDGWLEGAPEVAVEVLEAEQSFDELAPRAGEYLRAGAGMVWALDFEAKALALFTPPGEVRILGPEDLLDGGAVLPGFACRVSEFFG